MKKYLIPIFLVIPFCNWAQKPQKASIYKILKSLYTDLNNDGKTDTIILSNNGSDGSFNFISINLAGFTKQTFRAKQYWTDFDSSFLKRNKNLVNSNLLFVKKTEKQSVILLWGGIDGAGDGIEFSIINIENNHAKMVFDHDDEAIDVEVPLDLTSLNNDGRLNFIYMGYFQFSKPYKNGFLGAYNPRYVYTVDDSCKLNKPLMKVYNEKHYVFAGYRYSEAIDIYYPNGNSKPQYIGKHKSDQ